MWPATGHAVDGGDRGAPVAPLRGNVSPVVGDADAVAALKRPFGEAFGCQVPAALLPLSLQAVPWE